MKKPTSKSASETRKASSRSGTRINKADTAKSPRDEPGRFDWVVEKLREMSDDEFIRSLIRVGILDENRELTPHYKRRS